MAITPRSKGLGNIGAIVDRQGRASVAAPKAPVKPAVKATPKPAPRPAPKPVARIAPKPVPKLDPKPSPFKPVAKTTPTTGGRFVPPSDYDQLEGPGYDTGGGMGGQFNIAAPGQGNLARNTGPGNGAAPAPGDLYNRDGPYTPPPMDPGYDGLYTPGVGFGVGLPQTYEFQTAPDFGNYDNLPPPMDPGYGGPFTPRPDMGPGVGFGVGLPQPGFDGGYGNMNEGAPSSFGNQFNPGYISQGDMTMGGPQIGYSPGFGEPAPYNAGMMSPRRVINQVGKPGFQPRPNMSNAFNPTAVSDYDQLEGPGYDTGGGGFMGGSGSMFGGGGFGGR